MNPRPPSLPFSHGPTMLVMALAAVALCGCATTSPFPMAQESKPLEIQPQEKARTVSFARLSSEMKTGDEIGSIGVDIIDLPVSKVRWQEATLDAKADFKKEFEDELEKAGYKIPGDGPLQDDSDLRLTAVIAGAKLNEHFPLYDMGDFYTESYLKVRWVVRSGDEQKVALTVETEGAAKGQFRPRTDPNEAFHAAFAAATRNLLAQKQFHDLVVGTEGGDEAIKAPTLDRK